MEQAELGAHPLRGSAGAPARDTTHQMPSGLRFVVLLLATAEQSHCSLASRPSHELFVSPEGSDSAAGTSKAHPVQSLARAQALARTLLSASGGACSVTVSLLDGVFRLREPLILGDADSGGPEATATWRSHPDNHEAARISGSQQVDLSAFGDPALSANDQRIPLASREHVVAVNLSRVPWVDTLPLRWRYGNWCAPGRGCVLGAANRLELFAAVESSSKKELMPMRVARYPNIDAPPGNGSDGTGTRFKGYLAMGAAAKAEPGAPFLSVPWAGGAGAAGLPRGERPMRWQNSSQAMLHGMWSYQWTDNYIGIFGIHEHNASFGTFNLTNGAHYWPPNAGNPYYILDLLEELDEPGEYFIDRSSGVLFFWPPSNTGELVELSTCCFSATEGIGVPLVSAVNLSHFQLANVSLGPGRGSAFSCINCTDVALAGCSVGNFNGAGTEIVNGSGVSIARSVFRGLGQTAVTMVGGDRETLQPSNHSITDCDIGYWARWQLTGAPGVKIGGVRVLVAHNEIHHAPHHALEVSGNNHQIVNNHIHSVVLQTYDSGAIDNAYDGHSSGDLTWRGNVVAENLFHDLGDQRNFPLCPGQAHVARVQVAIYLDDHVSGWQIHDNVLAQSDMGVFIHFGRDNNITGNLFLDVGLAVLGADCDCCDECTADGMCGLNQQLLNRTQRWASWPQYLRHYPGLRNLSHACQARHNRLDSNAFVSCSGESKQQNATNETRLPVSWTGLPSAYLAPTKNFLAHKIDAVGFVSADPLAHRDFTVRADSPLWAVTGWTHQLPSHFGPR